ncbi:hypothetical protein YK48G_01270 [Lentilactobacillus fungorum]|uniref:Surface layer protein A domain-containing protein n=1 Tax=Lentilactobacillus fungorum TaxID=2201250 RepID=A0ABQ3VWL7_9LACO|nr:hypothetical protein [Lentilactobacillus fungorum]GHP12702.1 hypothetical protein YK48G_01270 [Lentilactobacillus fungorum]
MKVKNSILLGITALSLGISVFITNVAAANWGYAHWVTIRRTTYVYKTKIEKPMSNSYTVAKYKMHPGYHVKVRQSWVFPWVAESGRFNSGTHYAYVIERSGHSWFRQGIH